MFPALLPVRTAVFELIKNDLVTLRSAQLHVVLQLRALLIQREIEQNKIQTSDYYQNAMQFEEQRHLRVFHEVNQEIKRTLKDAVGCVTDGFDATWLADYEKLIATQIAEGEEIATVILEYNKKQTGYF